MPTNIRRVTRAPDLDLSPALRAFLESGERTAGDRETFALAGSPDRLAKLWHKLRREIMSAWMREHPACRPWCWWTCDAPQEPVETCPGFTAAQRRRLGGTGTPQHDIIALAPHFDRSVPTSWFDAAGAETFGGVAVDAEDPPQFESEAAYLQRHGLLTAPELKWLATHPEARAPEVVRLEDEP
jgi:hypothetical protein